MGDKIIGLGYDSWNSGFEQIFGVFLGLGRR